MFEHHRSLALAAAEVRPFRDPPDSWERRRHRYEEWLREPDARLFLAEREGEAVGYAVVRVRGAEASLQTGERVGELESLAVLPDARTAGVGTRLMERVYAYLRELGVKELALAVMEGNTDALRFYERHGLRPYVLLMLGRVP